MGDLRKKIVSLEAMNGKLSKELATARLRRRGKENMDIHHCTWHDAEINALKVQLANCQKELEKEKIKKTTTVAKQEQFEQTNAVKIKGLKAKIAHLKIVIEKLKKILLDSEMELYALEHPEAMKKLDA